MTDRDLLTKLNSLKNINPDSNWVASNRELLLSQISNSGARELSGWELFVINLGSLAKAASKPAYALAAFVFILITGSLFSHQVFGSAKPNDSLYIARIISEKAKLNTMFNSQERNKLAVQFATEHAQDISAVLADPQFNNESNKDQVAKLNESFNKEIDMVKSHISYLNQKLNNENTSATDTVLMANSLKDNSGVQVFESQPVAAQVVKSATSATRALNIKTDLATATANTLVATPIISTDSILDEAKQLFENKDYNKVSDKLKEVDEIIKK